MSNVLDRPRTSPGARREPAPAGVALPIVARGALAAGWAVAVGLGCLVVVVLVAWAADSGATAGAGEAMRVALQLWLLAHHTLLRIPSGGSLNIPPLALTALLALLLARSAAVLARSTVISDGRDAGVVVAAVAGPYAVIATVIAALAPTSSLRPSVGAAFVCAAVVGGLSATAGVVRGAGLSRGIWRSLAARTRASLATAAIAGSVLVAAATVTTVASLIAHAGRIGSLVGDYHGGSGQFSMVLLSLLYLPNAICCALAYLAGPGFAVGAGTSVTFAGAHLGGVPALPLLGALPSGPPPWQVEVVLVVAAVTAGVVAGRRLARRDDLDVRARVQAGVLGAVILGIAAAVVVGFGGGPAGPGRLSAVGGSPWQVGLAVAGGTALVVVATVAASARIGRLTGRRGAAG